MADQDQLGAAPAAATGQDAPRPLPHVTINVQYIKDLSFENPNAPASLVQQDDPPQIQVNVDVQARGVSEGTYESALRITATATRDEQSVFVAELVYAGVFTLHNIPAENHELVCLIECPRLIFPFARRVLSDAVRDGGFPPLFLEPIDFADLYRRHHRASSQAAETDGAAVGTA